MFVYEKRKTDTKSIWVWSMELIKTNKYKVILFGWNRNKQRKIKEERNLYGRKRLEGKQGIELRERKKK